MGTSKSQPISYEQLEQAYLRVKSNRGAAGVDGVSLSKFEKNLSGNLYKLWNRMASGSYQCKAVRAVSIPKGDGSMRKLGIPTVQDRIAQMVVKQVLEPQLDPLFDADSYGYRPNRSAHQAAEACLKRNWQYKWVLDVDIKGFFDNIPHKWLIRMLRHHEVPNWMVLYIKRFLKAPIQEQDGSVTKHQDKGTPQGGVISPLLANLYLHHVFDRWFRYHFADCAFERYADDIVIHCRSKEEAFEILEKLRARMQQYGLELHPEKTRIVTTKGKKRQADGIKRSFTFVGFTFKPRKMKTRKGEYFTGFGYCVSLKAERKIWEKIALTGIWERTNWEIEQIAPTINRYLRGWLKYFSYFSVSHVRTLSYRINRRLCQWLKKRYKIRTSINRAWSMLRRISRQQPNLFAHWAIGLRP